MALPAGANAARICRASLLGDNDEVLSTCFELHPGSDTRLADRYLSVHWLEYLGPGTYTQCLARLRGYLLNSPVPGEFKPTRNGRLAVLPCAQVAQTAQQLLNVAIDFEHLPRIPNVATSISVQPNGEIVMGIAPDQAVANNQALDPHSGLFTLPEEAAHLLAVQQHLSRSVVHSEQGIL